MTTKTLWERCKTLEELMSEWDAPTPAERHFRAWLLEQKGRNDPVGDVAADYAQALSNPKLCGYTDGGIHFVDGVPELFVPGACDAAKQALAEAWAEWRRLRYGRARRHND